MSVAEARQGQPVLDPRTITVAGQPGDGADRARSEEEPERVARRRPASSRRASKRDTAIPLRLSSHSDGWQTWAETRNSSGRRPGTTNSP